MKAAEGPGRQAPVASDRPNRFALIIGAMKAGTTSLFEYLATHPEVAPSHPKETDFFSDPGRWEAPGAEDAGGRDRITAYRPHWDWDPGVHRIALEASTSYTKRPYRQGIPERVKSLGDMEFRFVYLMRDPVSRLASHLSHFATRRGGANRVDGADFERAIQVSRYAMQLDAWTGHWPRETILPLVYEEMVEDPAAVVARVEAFLSLSPRVLDPALLQRAHNARIDMAADQALAGLLQRVPWLDAIRRWVPGPVRAAVRGVAGRWGRHDVTLTAAQRAHAVEVLRPEARRVREEWAVDTSRWESVA